MDENKRYCILLLLKYSGKQMTKLQNINPKL